MAAVNAADYSIATNGDIRYTGTGTNNTVIEFHRWLGDLMDNAAAVGNDLLDITSATASARSTDNIITLNSPYNIDDVVAQHLYDGSVIQGVAGTDIWDGIVCFAAANTYLTIIQNGKIVSPNFWTTGLNADTANGISHKFMIKVRSAGADIDGRRLIGQTREFGKTYSEFNINGTARGNNVLALTFATDLNNATAVATVAGWNTIVNTEGLNLLDVNNDTVNEQYYSQWDRAALTVNQLYERTKWLSRRATSLSAGTDTGTDFNIGDGTILGQAQSFANGAKAAYATRVFANLKAQGAPTGNLVAKIYAHSGTFGSSSIPTGSALATSKNFDTSKLTTAYITYEIGFDTQFELLASTNYTVSFEFTGTSTNYVKMQGLAASGTHAGNRSQLVSSTWTATAGDDLNFDIHTSPKLYNLTGELFRGVTHEVPVKTGAGTFSAVEAVSWTGGTGQLLAVDVAATPRMIWLQLLTGVAPSGTLTITGGTSAATATVNGTALATTAASGTGTVATITFAAQGVTPFPAGTTVTVAGVTPTAYNGTFLSTGGSTTTVTYASAATGAQTVAGTVVAVIGARTLSQPFIGASTGSALIGAYGLGVKTSTLTASDKLFDLTNTQRVPPNNVTFTVSGLKITAPADRVLVGPSSAGALQTNQLTLATTLSSATETAVVCTTTIPSDTPTTGTIRIQLDTGIYRLVSYTSFASATFTIASTDFTGVNVATQPRNVFISYIDKVAAATSETFTVVYNVDRTVFVRVRNGDSVAPIKTFESTGTVGSAGGSATAIRTTDL